MRKRVDVIVLIESLYTTLELMTPSWEILTEELDEYLKRNLMMFGEVLNRVPLLYHCELLSDKEYSDLLDNFRYYTELANVMTARLVSNI